MVNNEFESETSWLLKHPLLAARRIGLVGPDPVTSHGVESSGVGRYGNNVVAGRQGQKGVFAIGEPRVRAGSVNRLVAWNEDQESLSCVAVLKAHGMQYRRPTESFGTIADVRTNPANV